MTATPASPYPCCTKGICPQHEEQAVMDSHRYGHTHRPANHVVAIKTELQYTGTGGWPKKRVGPGQP